jgi:hypothetical protein
VPDEDPVSGANWVRSWSVLDELSAVGPDPRVLMRTQDKGDPMALSYCSACGHPARRSEKYCGRGGQAVVTSPPGNAVALGCAAVAVLVPVAPMVTCFVMSPGSSVVQRNSPGLHRRTAGVCRESHGYGAGGDGHR